MVYLLKRFFQMIFILLILSVSLFGILSVMPGNAVDMLITSNPRVRPEDIVRLKKLRGLDQPWYIQYYRWLWGYYEPALAPKILPLKPITVESNTKRVEIDLKPYLVDPNYMPKKVDIELWLSKLWPSWNTDISSKAIKLAISSKDISQLQLVLAEKDPVILGDFLSLMENKSSDQLEVGGLFGAKAVNFTITKDFLGDNKEPIWFFVKNHYGQMQVAFIPVILDEKEYAPPINIPTQVLSDIEKPVKIKLKKFLKGNMDAQFKVAKPDFGNIDDDGIYVNKFKIAGQTVIPLEVKTNDNKHFNMAFAIEHGVVANKEKFNRGFLFFFANDKNALGFSQTYKRPVYELLFGPAIICGDNKIDPGEDCDDGNIMGDDATCGSDCFKKTDSIFDKLSSIIGGYIVRLGRIGNTVQLMFPAFLLSIIIAIPLGIFSAYRQYSRFDYLVNFLAFIGISLPVFWFGIMMMYVFAENLQMFPAGGAQSPTIYGEGILAIVSDRLKHAVLPTIVLSILFIGRWLRYVRASMLEVLPKDYVRTARAKGLSEKTVILKHASRNALIPVVTIITLSIPTLFGGALLTETVFSWPGVGRLQYEAVMNSDYYVAIVVFLILAFLVMLGNLLADILYVIIDPRIRKG